MAGQLVDITPPEDWDWDGGMSKRDAKNGTVDVELGCLEVLGCFCEFFLGWPRQISAHLQLFRGRLKRI